MKEREKIDYSFLIKTSLFEGILESESQDLLTCLHAYTKYYKKGDTIYHALEHVKTLGLILSGGVSIENDDIWGNRTILDTIGSGQVFAETYACLPNEALMVHVVAATETEILFLNVERLFTACQVFCSYHSKLIQNLLAVTAQKNLNLTHKIFHTTPKSIRKRLLSYLSFQAKKQKTCQLKISFNRQQLADYLNVDRSAMSHELSKMKKDGLITLKGHRITLLSDFPFS